MKLQKVVFGLLLSILAMGVAPLAKATTVTVTVTGKLVSCANCEDQTGVFGFGTNYFFTGNETYTLTMTFQDTGNPISASACTPSRLISSGYDNNGSTTPVVSATLTVDPYMGSGGGTYSYEAFTTSGVSGEALLSDPCSGTDTYFLQNIASYVSPNGSASIEGDVYMPSGTGACITSPNWETSFSACSNLTTGGQPLTFHIDSSNSGTNYVAVGRLTTATIAVSGI